MPDPGPSGASEDPPQPHGASRRIGSTVRFRRCGGYREGSDTVTKFRIPEGISWVERRADLP